MLSLLLRVVFLIYFATSFGFAIAQLLSGPGADYGAAILSLPKASKCATFTDEKPRTFMDCDGHKGEKEVYFSELKKHLLRQKTSSKKTIGE